MTYAPHANYAALVEKVAHSHERGRSPEGIDETDIGLARLYSYGFRLHTIGAYHATRLALTVLPAAGALAMAHRVRAIEALEDLANQAMELIPSDFRAALSTFHRYDRGTRRVIEALAADRDASGDREIGAIAERFERIIGDITSGSGIHVTRDTEPEPQASFVVPNLGITIVPLVYGDYHSWNLAFLNGERSDVPAHRHHDGVEIHLGYSPIKGYMVLGDHAAPVTEGYALPIPPQTRHGYFNDCNQQHNVPFVFGSMRHGGWGVFLDVEAQPTKLSDLKTVARDSTPLRQSIFLEREIAAAARSGVASRRVLIPATVTDRNGSGGLELSVVRVLPRPFKLSADTGFLAVSVVRGAGTVEIGAARRTVSAHDHFAIPAGMAATLHQEGDEPLVLLDASIRRRTGGPSR